MSEGIAMELLKIVNEAAAELRLLSEESAAAKPNPDVWSVKEIVGHLIDSAANNHQRFVRAQHVQHFEFPGYEQEPLGALAGLSELHMARTGRFLGALQSPSRTRHSARASGGAGHPLSNR